MTAPQRSAWLRTYLSVGSGRVTAVFWAALGLMAIGLFIPRLLPMVDYPQHLGMAEMARRLFDPSSPEHQSFSVNWFTYNGLFHLLTAILGSICGVETAGRIVVSLALVGLGGAVLALLKELRRPPWYAALFVPAIFSTSVAWGFINYSLGMALAVTTLVFIVRMLERPSLRLALGIAFLGLLLGFTHVLAMAILCILATSLAPELAWRTTGGLGLDRESWNQKSDVFTNIIKGPICLFIVIRVEKKMVN